MTPTKITDLKAQVKKSSREITHCFVHCTAGWQNETNANLIKGFRALGWKSNGYHFVIDADGTIWQITHLDKLANGVAGYNSNAIHISYKGGIAKSGVPKDKGKLIPVDNRTEAQKKSMLNLLKHLKSLHKNSRILGHRDISPDKNKNGVVDSWERIKECPCFDAIPEYSKL